jgi:hypothetical protein
MHRMRTLLLASALLVPGTAAAAADPPQPAPAMPSEHRLSPDQIKSILDDAARKRELAQLPEEGLAPAIHGEIGLSIGTGGYRSAFGTAVVPLFDNGVAIVSFGADNMGSAQAFDYPER